MTHQSESGRNRNERQEHDRKARAYEETTPGNPYHLSPGARAALTLLVVVVLIAMTLLFVSGVFHL